MTEAENLFDGVLAMKAEFLSYRVARRLFTAVLFGALIVLSSPSVSRGEGPVGQRAMILPHVEANEDFFTGLSLLNVGEEASRVVLVAYSENGRVVGEKDALTLSPGQWYLSSVASEFGLESAARVSWIKVEYTGNLTGFGLIGNDAQLARIPLQADGKKTLILPYVVSGDGLFTELYILNADAGLAALTLGAYDSGGRLLKEVNPELAIGPGQKLTGSVEDFFGAEVSAETSWMKVQSDGSIIGMALVGTTDRLFSVTME
jgi:hypothetical protein